MIAALLAAARLGTILVVVGAPGLARAKLDWPAIPPAEIAETHAVVEPDAPAEILVWKYEADDSDYPMSRTTTEYFRCKVYAPEKAEQITQLSRLDTQNTERLDVRARLTLPNGRVQEFGPESIKERTLSRDAKSAGLFGLLAGGGNEVKEKFLAVPGIERGAIIEFRIVRTENRPGRIVLLPIQRETFPIRLVEYVVHECSPDSGFISRSFVMNRRDGKIVRDAKNRVTSFTVANLPSVVREPFLGPIGDYAMAMLTAYEQLQKILQPRSNRVSQPDRVDPKLGAWTFYSTLWNWMERDRGYATPKIKSLAAQITAGAPDEGAKAKAIHAYVRGLYQEARRRPAVQNGREAESLDEVVDFKRYPQVLRPGMEFVWLAIALYQSAGLEAHLIMMPDRSLCRFRPEFVSPALLPHPGIAVRVAGAWTFSAPQNLIPLPFGELPARCEGQPGLLALDHRQEFITVPMASADQSVMQVDGSFAVDGAGTLTGECTRTMTGHLAASAREALRRTDAAARMRVARQILHFDAKLVRVSRIEVAGVNDPDAPLKISAHIQWPGYATRTKERLLLRPAVLQAEETTPFPASERRYPISFPYKWRETDRITIALPEGFVPEAPTAEPALDVGALYHRVQLAYDPKHRVLHVTRDFKTEAVEVLAANYDGLRKWYDAMTTVDRREVVFLGSGVPMPAAPATTEPAAAAGTGEPAEPVEPTETSSADATGA